MTPNADDPGHGERAAPKSHPLGVFVRAQTTACRVATAAS